ncbi:MAG: tetratricopeptide repeat protein [candidate division Zixibacteria bacterium]|nr:tetratricopeptide repeat protein [candidate division Zixibacteria bacterium]
MRIFGYEIIDPALFWTIVLGVAAILVALFAYILPRRTRLREEEEERLRRIEEDTKVAKKESKEANENVKLIEKHLGIPIYVDGLPKADPPVFDPFAKGVKLMAEYKWDEAVIEFKQSMKEAKASQLVALYNLIGLCYYTPGKLDLTLENWNKSLSLAREFNDREGEASALGNLGIVYKTRGELDRAIKYHQDALKIDREIGNKKGEAEDLGNLGNVYKTRGELDKAIKYYEDALKLNQELGRKEGMANQLGNLGLIFEEKGEKEKALKYFEDALKLFTQIGAQREIETVKESIKRLKGE